MAMFKFRDCLASEVKSQPIINGTFIVCRDTGDMYCDNLEGERVSIAKTVHVVNGKVNSELYPENGHIYYSTTDRQVCIYVSGKFMPINIAVCISKLDACFVSKSGNATFNVNPAGNDKLNANYPGVIFSVLGHKLSTDISIADLDSQLVGNGSVSFGSISRGDSGIWTVTINNSNSTLNWLGSIEVIVLMVTDYVNA